MTFEHSTGDPTVADGFREEAHAEHEQGEKVQRSMMALVGVGLGLGVVHVLTGPDHLTALMSLSVSAHYTPSPARIAPHRLCRRPSLQRPHRPVVSAQGLPEVHCTDAAG